MTNYDIIGQRIESLACNKCRTVMDVSEAEPFSIVQCPGCGAQQTVPKRLGNFILLRFLGKGGMGAVFQAYDPKLGRQVAIKVLGDVLGTASDAMDNFLREARAAAQINSPNVVQIFQVGEESGQPFIVMELISGGQLDNMIEEAPLPELQALEVCKHAAQGLYAAQEIGLFHGDIKPENILFDPHGTAKIADFGLAQYLQRGKKSHPGEIWGTPYYIAPEKARRQQEDYRSDIYSLGATLFHALTGQPPFEGETAAEVVLARLKEEAPDIREIDPNLHESTAVLVARMLDPDPALRYPNYASLLSDLDDVISAVKRSKQQRDGSSGKRGKFFLILLVLLLIGAGIGAYFLHGKSTVFTKEEDQALAARIKRWSRNKYLHDAGPLHTVNDSLVTFSKGLTPEHGGRTWINVMQGSILTLGMHTNEMVELLTPIAERSLPETIDNKPNPNRMPQLIAQFYISTNSAFDPGPQKWPAWFNDVSDYFAAVKLMSQSHYIQAQTLLQRYAQKSRAEDAPRWPYSFQPVAITLSESIHRWETRQDLLNRLIARGDTNKVVGKLENYQVDTPPIFMHYILSNRERLNVSPETTSKPEQTAEMSAEAERIRQEEEASRKQREKEAREALEKKQKEREEQRLQEEAEQAQREQEQHEEDLAADLKKLQDGIVNLGPTLQKRQFGQAKRDIMRLGKQQITEEGDKNAATYSALMETLQALNKYVVKEIGDTKLSASLTKKLGGTPKRATSKEIILSRTHGETAKDWDQIKNATYIKIADQVIAKGRENDSTKAEYFMALAVYGKLIGAPESWVLRYKKKAEKYDSNTADKMDKLLSLTPQE